MIVILLILRSNILGMINLFSNLKISVPDKIFIKDPESSDLGKRIIEHSILLIDEIGFDSFTFKKLGVKIGSNESSIYRYFESKHNSSHKKSGCSDCELCSAFFLELPVP